MNGFQTLVTTSKPLQVELKLVDFLYIILVIHNVIVKYTV